MTKIVQIAVTNDGQLYALASDGSLHFRKGAYAPGRQTWKWEPVELPEGVGPASSTPPVAVSR